MTWSSESHQTVKGDEILMSRLMETVWGLHFFLTQIVLLKNDGKKELTLILCSFSK